LHETRLAGVSLFVTRAILLLPLAFVAVLGAVGNSASAREAHKDARLDSLIHAVEQRYNKARTLSVDFSETYYAGKQARRTESGTLELRKPGKMRWNYAAPPGKVFLSDGKNFYLYDPTTQRVEKSRMRDSEDLRAPMAFLLGKLNFYKEFGGFSERSDGVDTWLTAEPDALNVPYSKVEFLITPEARIRRLRVTGDDLSILDFAFSNEKLNAPMDDQRFAFRLPAGAELEDASQ